MTHSKWREPLLWIAVPVLIQLAMSLYEFDPAKVVDWRAYGISLAALAVRELAKQVVAYLTSRRFRAQDGALDFVARSQGEHDLN